MPSAQVFTSEPANLDKPGLVHDKPHGWLLIITGAIAWLASSILVLERLELYKNPNANASCDFNAWISCSEVMKTPQAAILGFPNPFIGIVAFAVVITVGVVLLAGAQMQRWFWIAIQVGITAGMALVCWFWFTALYTLAVLCPYCMIVWAMMIPLFVWTTVRNINHGIIPAPPALAKFINEWAWVIMGLLYVTAIGSIFFRFMHLIIPSNA